MCILSALIYTLIKTHTHPTKEDEHTASWMEIALKTFSKSGQDTLDTGAEAAPCFGQVGGSGTGWSYFRQLSAERRGP